MVVAGLVTAGCFGRSVVPCLGGLGVVTRLKVQMMVPPVVCANHSVDPKAHNQHPLQHTNPEVPLRLLFGSLSLGSKDWLSGFANRRGAMSRFGFIELAEFALGRRTKMAL